jgi:hypothetical protein
MTFAAVGSPFLTDGDTWTLTPSAVGDLLCVPILTDSATNYATALSSSNVSGGWTQVGYHLDTTNTRSVALFIGKVTAASAATVTVTWSGTSDGYVRGTGQEFSSSAGSWTADTWTYLASAGTSQWPSLTAAGSGELYFGWALNGGTATGTSGSGWVLSVDTHGNGQEYNVSTGPSTVTPKAWSDGSQQTGIMALIKELPAAVVSQGPLKNNPAIIVSNAGWRGAGHSR